MGDPSQKNFYDVIRALESGRTYKRPKVQAGVTIEEVSQVQPQPIALPATIATHEAVRAGLNAEVVETFAARDEAFPTSEHGGRALRPPPHGFPRCPRQVWHLQL